jgi:transposase-like protein
VNLRRNGTDYKGKQKYSCQDCGSYGTLNPSEPGYSAERKHEILRAYQERPSMRGIERIYGVARQTLARWLREEAATLPE